MPTPLNEDKELRPIWATIAAATATLITNYQWQSWFSQVDGMEGFLLMFACLLGWPLTLLVVLFILSFALKRSEDHVLVCMAIVLAVIGAGIAIYGVPRPWNMVVCAIMAVGIGFKAFRAAQDDADLRSL